MLPEDEVDLQSMLDVEVLPLWELMAKQAQYDVNISSASPWGKANLL